MDIAAGNNAGLMRRIVQLEAEKSELQRDIETLCMQQSSLSGSHDVFSRMQTRSSANMEWQSMTGEDVLEQTTSQEVENCKQKLAFQAQESLNLQEELAEAYRAKGKVADAFKATMDKNKELEKEVKYYQSRMAAAFCERDKAALEVEKLRAAERSMIKDMANLRHSLEDMSEQCHKTKARYAELEESRLTIADERQRALEVVNKFWNLREAPAKNEGLSEGPAENGNLHEEARDRVKILLEDLDKNWVYSTVQDTTVEDSHKATERALEDLKEEFAVSKAASTKLEEKLSLTQDTTAKLAKELALVVSDSTRVREDLESSTTLSSKLAEELRITKAVALEESSARKEAEQKLCTCYDQLVSRTSDIHRKCTRLRAEHATLKAIIFTSVEEEKIHSLQMEEFLENLLQRCAKEQNDETAFPLKDGVLLGESSLQASIVTGEVTQDLNMDELNDVSIKQQTKTNVTEDDSKEILAQAMQEKMEALLLLSQQEERYLHEAATQSALESEIRSLNQKLAQVAGEKVVALMELADERKQLQQFRERERGLLQRLEYGAPSTSEVDVSDKVVDNVLANEDAPKTKQNSTSGVSKRAWWKGMDLSSLKTVASATYYSSGFSGMSGSSRNDSNARTARLLVENAALHERMASVEHLAQSANRLRMLLSKVAGETQGDLAPPEIQSAIEVVDSVKTEAESLTATVGSALPVSFQEPLESGSRVSRGKSQSERQSEIVTETGSTSPQDNDYVYKIGVEVVELLLALAEVHAESLLTRLNLASID